MIRSRRMIAPAVAVLVGIGLAVPPASAEEDGGGAVPPPVVEVPMSCASSPSLPVNLGDTAAVTVGLPPKVVEKKHVPVTYRVGLDVMRSIPIAAQDATFRSTFAVSGARSTEPVVLTQSAGAVAVGDVVEPEMFVATTEAGQAGTTLTWRLERVEVSASALGGTYRFTCTPVGGPAVVAEAKVIAEPACTTPWWRRPARCWSRS